MVRKVGRKERNLGKNYIKLFEWLLKKCRPSASNTGLEWWRYDLFRRWSLKLRKSVNATWSDGGGDVIPLREWAVNGPKIWDNDNVRGTIWRWHTRQRTVAAIPENEDTFSSNHRQFRKWVGWRGKTQKATIASHSILLSCTEQLNGIEKRISHLPGRTDRLHM